MKFQVKKKLRSKDSFIRNHRNLPNVFRAGKANYIADRGIAKLKIHKTRFATERHIALSKSWPGNVVEWKNNNSRKKKKEKKVKRKME